MEFWSQDVLGCSWYPFLNLCFYWMKQTVGACWSKRAISCAQLCCVQQPCSVTLYRNGSLMDSVRFAPEFADVSKTDWWESPSQQMLPGTTMEIRLSKSQIAKICWMSSVYLLHVQCAQILLTSNVSSSEAHKSYSKKPDLLLGQGCFSCSRCIMIRTPYTTIVTKRSNRQTWDIYSIHGNDERWIFRGAHTQTQKEYHWC